MTKLDPTFSSVIEIDSHALHTVTGGVPPATSAAKPKKKGKGKQILAGGLMLLGPLTGHYPGPDEVDLGGSLVGGPQGKPPAGAPPVLREPKPIPVPGGGVIIVPE